MAKKITRRKAKTLKDEAPEFKVTVSFDTPSSGEFEIEDPDTGSIASTKDGGWVLNPSSTFPLTIHGINKTTAEELKRLIDAGYSIGTYSHARTIVPIIARSNLHCKEIDTYINQFKPQYLNKIEEQKQLTTEWESASARDKEDLLTGFRQQAIKSLDVIPYCDLETLFECEPKDFTLDDALIDRFGFEVLHLYLRYAGNLDKVRVLHADHPERAGFEKMVDLSLARRGMDISLNAILETLKLKDMNNLVADLIQKPFGRKSKAIEYLMTLPDLQERVGKIVAFRELFQLKPLPEEFSRINLSKISESWAYANEIATLIAHTYVMGGYASRRIYEDLSYITGWELSTCDDEATCSYCKRAASMTYSKNQPPKAPLHIGCRCSVLPKIED